MLLGDNMTEEKQIINNYQNVDIQKLFFKNNNIDQGWKDLLKKDCEEKFQIVNEQIQKSVSKNSDKLFFPYKTKNIYNTFKLCSYESLKVVIIGQDPYAQKKEQSVGLAFSVSNSVTAPPSLKNIFKEIENCGYGKRTQNDLSDWAEQGVLLLNSALTVIQQTPLSHIAIWEDLTDKIIELISKDKEKLIFALWGNYAISKKKFIDTQRHICLQSTHPSPFSCSKGAKSFFGSNVFKNINQELKKMNKKEIKWVD